MYDDDIPWGKIIGIGAAILISLSVTGWAFGWFREAAQVTQEEFGPRAALKKYEWFKQQAEMVKQSDAQIEQFKKRVKGVDEQYASYGQDKTKWPPVTLMQYQQDKKQASDDLMAIIAQRNTVVRDYNAASGMFNWAPFKSKSDAPPEHLDEYLSQ